MLCRAVPCQCEHGIRSSRLVAQYVPNLNQTRPLNETGVYSEAEEIWYIIYTFYLHVSSEQINQVPVTTRGFRISEDLLYLDLWVGP